MSFQIPMHCVRWYTLAIYFEVKRWFVAFMKIIAFFVVWKCRITFETRNKKKTNISKETPAIRKVDRLTRHTIWLLWQTVENPSSNCEPSQTAWDLFCWRKSPPLQLVLWADENFLPLYQPTVGIFEVDHYAKINTTFSTNLMRNFVFRFKQNWNYPNQFNNNRNGFRKVWNFLMDCQVNCRMKRFNHSNLT